MDLLHFILFVILRADCQQLHKRIEFDKGHVSQDDLPERVICSKEVQQEGIKLPRGGREIEERGPKEMLIEETIELWHSSDGLAILIEECVTK